MLQNLIKQLDNKEFQDFYRKLGNQKRKKQLLKFAFERRNQHLSFEEISKFLGYSNNIGSFNTLKHRLTKDLEEYKQRSFKNEIAKIESRIHQLRSLLYSKDLKFLKKEIKDLKLRVNQLEIFNGRYEIYFCEYLLNYHNHKRRDQLYQLMEEALEKERIFNLCELEFFKVIFEYQDFFFNFGIYEQNKIKQKSLEKLTQFHETLQSSVSDFFLLSAELTFELRLNQKKEVLDNLGLKIKRIKELYFKEKISERFPNCNFAIDCLFNKYYLVSCKSEEFNKSTENLLSIEYDILGLRTYEDVMFYFLYAYSRYTISCGNFENLINKINYYMNFADEMFYSEKLIFYLHHLKAFSFIYSGNLKSAEKHLLLARNFRKSLEEPALWIEIENSLLNIAIQIKNKSNESANYEINQLKKLIRKININQQPFIDFIKFTQAHIIKNIKVFYDFKQALKELQKKTGLLHMVVWTSHKMDGLKLK